MERPYTILYGRQTIGVDTEKCFCRTVTRGTGKAHTLALVALQSQQCSQTFHLTNVFLYGIVCPSELPVPVWRRCFAASTPGPARCSDAHRLWRRFRKPGAVSASAANRPSSAARTTRPVWGRITRRQRRLTAPSTCGPQSCPRRNSNLHPWRAGLVLRP